MGGQRVTGLTKEQAERILYSQGKDRSAGVGMVMAKRLMKSNPNIKMQQMPTRYGTDAALGGIKDSSYLDTFQGAI